MAAKNEDETTYFNVLLGVTGSVAAIKIPLLVKQLLQFPNVKVKVVVTRNCLHFFDQASLSVDIYEDKDEWKMWTKIGDPVLHIELRRWADIFVIAPLDANTMAKLSNGICDNLLTCVARAWDVNKPLLYCPAMNTHMWQHPLTEQHLKIMESLNYILIPPISKNLACGDIGVGAMAEVPTIVQYIEKYQQLKVESDLAKEIKDNATKL